MTHPTSGNARPGLAGSELPRRVRKTLDQALNLVSITLDPGLNQMLDEFEKELFRLTERSWHPGNDSPYSHAMRTFRAIRPDLVPHFMLELERGLASLRRPASGQAEEPDRRLGHELSLVDDSNFDENTLLREIATRQEGRASLAMHLLGQRFGVLAGSPALDGERLPLGPHKVCRALRDTCRAMGFGPEARELLYRLFDRIVMSGYATVLEKLDAALDQAGILRGLTHVPVRRRPPSGRPAEEQEAGAGTAPAAAGHAGPAPPGAAADQAPSWHPAPAPGRPHTGWIGEAAPAPAPASAGQGEQEAYQALAHLLAERRARLDKLRPSGGPPVPETVLGTGEVMDTLAAMQRQNAPPGGTRPTLMDLRQMLLAQARQRHGQPAALSQRDDDVFELLHLLYTRLAEEIRGDAPAAALIQRLQVPLLRVALKDQAFFVQPAHPARELLGTVADAAAKWLDKDDLDPQMLLPLQQAVSHVVDAYDGDDAVFEASNDKLQAQLQAQVRKAEMLERRHIEAARGKEKLEVAKRRASALLEELVGERQIPKFSRALLNQAWADVLTLSLLRQGEDSPEWQAQLDATRRIIATCTGDTDAGGPDLAGHIEGALSQVGYHADEAGIIAGRLTSSRSDEEDPASRTELALKLKAHARLGEDAAERARRPALPPRTPEEQAHYEELRVLPFGTWIEFTTNQQGDVVRRRMSWFSPVTDNALFVNQRGQRIGEQSLDSLARMMAAGQARTVTTEQARLVDRAWQAAMRALRSFAGHGDAPASATAGAGP